MEKAKKLEKYIDHISEVTGMPYWYARIEMADEAEVSNLVDFTEEDIDKMIALYEKYYPINK